MRPALLAAIALVVVTAASAGPARPLVVAHRGGALLWPENTLTAFRGALALGSDLVELDVHLARDGEVVVIHDPTLDRTTSDTGPVADRTGAELAAVGVPRLREVLELLSGSGAGLLLEIKVGIRGVRYPGIEEKVLGLLARAGLTDRTTVMAFEWDTVERLRVLSSSVRLTGLLSRRGAELLGGVPVAASRLAKLGANDLGIERTLLSPEAVKAARAAGLTIGVWTVNEPEELRAALAAGVDYVTTDRPDLALQLRGRP
jgi:glycerophosphoryl diester phosphodiesterase